MNRPAAAPPRSRRDHCEERGSGGDGCGAADVDEEEGPTPRRPRRTLDHFLEIDHRSRRRGSNGDDCTDDEEEEEGDQMRGGRLQLTKERKHHRKASPPPPSKRFVCVRYATLATLALVLTITCPGRTLLWQNQQQRQKDMISGGGIMSDGDRIDGGGRHDDDLEEEHLPPLMPAAGARWSALVPILLSYGMTLMLFFHFVIATDPGYLTRELADRDVVVERHCPPLEDRLGRGNADDDEANATHGEEEAGLVPVDAARLETGHLDESGGGDDFEGEGSPLFGPSRFGGGDDNDDSADRCRRQPRRPNRRPYCRVCRLDPPLRAHHCKKCHRCVATFDHHCELLGGCVGERNRGIFVLFLLVQAVGLALCLRAVLTSSLGLSTLLFGIATAGRQQKQYVPSNNNASLSGVTTVSQLDVVRVVTAELYLVPLAFAALLMAAAHVVLVAANVTTFECARQRHLDYLKTLNGDHVLSDPPFSRGIAQNLVLAFRASFDGQEPWTPIMWEVPADCTSKADSDSTDWWENLWRNKYWSCC